jgi:tripartite-type tricarboxylate transporter receptor subunit TctC
VIENKPGAAAPSARQHGGERAAGRLHGRAASDHGVPHAVHPEDHFDPTKDFTYIIHVTGYTFGVVVKADAPWKTFQELLDYAKANPGKINYGTPGAGTSLHITMEQIAKLKGIRWTHVPFKGVSESMNALLGGHIDVVSDSTGWAGSVDGGQARLAGHWGAGRTRNWPNVPNLKESGIDMSRIRRSGSAGRRAWIRRW